LLAVGRRYRAMGAPLDAVVQDWQYWPQGGWGGHEFDPARFPDPAGMVRTLHAEHIHSIISARFRPA
jgi:alpha-D-xyloside xylohydrolase